VIVVTAPGLPAGENLPMKKRDSKHRAEQAIDGRTCVAYGSSMRKRRAGVPCVLFVSATFLLAALPSVAGADEKFSKNSANHTCGHWVAEHFPNPSPDAWDAGTVNNCDTPLTPYGVETFIYFFDSDGVFEIAYFDTYHDYFSHLRADRNMSQGGSVKHYHYWNSETTIYATWQSTD